MVGESGLKPHKKIEKWGRGDADDRHVRAQHRRQGPSVLAIYPQSTWDKFTEKFASLPMTQSKVMRPLFANAVKCELDSQGRIVIPQKLRKYAKLEKDAVILGVNDRAEIWSAQLWYQDEEEMTPEKMAACMSELGF